MTQDEIIEMAQECNLIGMRPHLDGIYFEALTEFANLVAAKEREALANVATEDTSKERVDEIQKLRHEQEPVAHRDGFWCKDLTCRKCYAADFRFIHTTPPQRKPLTDEQITAGWRTLPIKAQMSWSAYLAGARMAEAAHGIKE